MHCYGLKLDFLILIYKPKISNRYLINSSTKEAS